jgi:hypothetical protein
MTDTITTNPHHGHSSSQPQDQMSVQVVHAIRLIEALALLGVRMLGRQRALVVGLETGCLEVGECEELGHLTLPLDRSGPWRGRGWRGPDRGIVHH